MECDRKHVVVGLMGGIGSGKSKIAAMFHELGAEIVNADLMVHDILKLPQVKRQITDIWGEEVVAAGEIDKRKLAGVVFAGPARSDSLKKLEAIIHPLVRRDIEARLQQIAVSGRVAVVDAPLLWEGGLYKRCDVLIFVDTPQEVREARVVKDRGWRAGEISSREKFQGNLEEKRRIAHHLVFNGASESETFRQVQGIWENHIIREIVR